MWNADELLEQSLVQLADSGDVQSSAVMSIVLGDRVNIDSALRTRWLVAYIGMLYTRSLYALCSMLVRSFARSLVRSFARSLVRSFARSLVRSFARSLVRSFARSLVCSFDMNSELLHRCELWAEANDLIRYSEEESIRTANQKSTTIHTSCQNCRKPLYRSTLTCEHCKTKQNTCSIWYALALASACACAD
jgi:hypothetical protein